MASVTQEHRIKAVETILQLVRHLHNNEPLELSNQSAADLEDMMFRENPTLNDYLKALSGHMSKYYVRWYTERNAQAPPAPAAHTSNHIEKTHSMELGTKFTQRQKQKQKQTHKTQNTNTTQTHHNTVIDQTPAAATPGTPSTNNQRLKNHQQVKAIFSNLRTQVQVLIDNAEREALAQISKQ